MKNQYFVVEPALIVAQDLAHAIRVCDPSAEVRVFSEADEALDALSDSRPRAVFLHCGPTLSPTRRIDLALREMNVPIAYTGSEVEDFPIAAHVMASPFTEATVAAILQEILQSP